jgi:hypothetical protein
VSTATENFILTHDQQLFAIELNLAAGILSEEDPVADLNVKGHNLAVFEALALPDCSHFAFLRLLFRRIGDDEPAGGLFILRVEPFYYDPVVERSNVHTLNLH